MGLVVSLIVVYPAGVNLPDLLRDIDTLDDLSTPTTAYGLSVVTALPITEFPFVANSTTTVHADLLGGRVYKATALVFMVGEVTFEPNLLPIQFAVSATPRLLTSCDSPPVVTEFASVTDLWTNAVMPGAATAAPFMARLRPRTVDDSAADPAGSANPMPSAPPSRKDLLQMARHALHVAKSAPTPPSLTAEPAASPASSMAILTDTVLLRLCTAGHWVVQATLPVSVPYIMTG